LAKALKMDRKRKEEAASSSSKAKKKGKYSHAASSSYGRGSSQAVAQFSPHVPPPPIVKHETRTCLVVDKWVIS